MSRAPRVLFVTYGGGHVAMTLPVVRSLESQLPGIDCQVMALTTAFRQVSTSRTALRYQDFLHLVDAVAAREWGLYLRDQTHHPDVSEAETIAYLGINYLDLIAQHGESAAAQLYREHGRHCFKPMHFMRRVIASLQPDIVVATNSPRTEQAAIEVACDMGIPTLGMLDLYGLDTDAYASRTTMPDVICVIADVVRQRLLRRGVPPERVIVTGNPAFDGLFSAQNMHDARVFREKMGWQSRSCVLWAGHSEAHTHPNTPAPAGMAFPIEVERVLREHVVAHDGLSLVVRYHPSDWFRYPRHQWHPRIHFSETSHEPLHPLLLASNVVVVQTSTVGLEAAVAGKPVLAIENSPSAQGEFNLVRLGVANPCETAAQLPQRLDDVLRGALQTRATEYAGDGRSAHRVAILLAQALNDPHNAFQVPPLSDVAVTAKLS